MAQDVYTSTGQKIGTMVKTGLGLPDLSGGLSGIGERAGAAARNKALGAMSEKLFSGDSLFAKAGQKMGLYKPRKEKGPEQLGNTGGILKSIAESSAVIPDMAKDVNIIAQNMQQLVELNKPDADDFFRQEDMEEAQKESEGQKAVLLGGKPEGDEPPEAKKGGLLGLVSKFGSGIAAAFKKVFNFKNLLKVFKKIFLPIAIIGSLFKGIKDGFERYRETGSISEAIFAGLGGVLEFLTFGFFGEDTIRNIYDKLSSFFEPVSKSIQKVFGGIKDFFAGLFGKKVENVTPSPTEKPDIKPTEPEVPKNLQEDSVQQLRDNLEKTDLKTTPVSYQPEQQQGSKQNGQDGKAAVGNFLDNTGASQMLGENIMPMMGNIKSGTGSSNMGDMAKQGFGAMFGGMGKGMGVDAGALTGDLKGGIQGIKNSEDKQAGLMSALGNLASNPAIQNFRGKPSDEASRMKNVNQASSGLSNLLGGAMGGMGIDTKSLQDQYGSKPMTPQKSSPSIYDKGGTKGPSGGDINERSSNISEGQRMEAAADYGDVVNNSVTNNSKGTTQSNDRSVSEVMNKDLFLQLNLGNQLPDTI